MSKIFLFLFLLTGFTSGSDQSKDSRITSEQSQKKNQKTDFRDFYGIAWNGKPHDNLMYAKQMGYGYVFYQAGMEKDPLAKDLKFYIESPQYSVYPVPRIMDLIPLSSRSWDGTIYKSPKSYMDSNVISSTHPNSGKIFAVWLTRDGVVPLPEKSKFLSVFHTDSLFIETTNGKADIQLTNNGLKLTNKEGLGKGYIFTIPIPFPF